MLRVSHSRMVGLFYRGLVICRFLFLSDLQSATAVLYTVYVMPGAACQTSVLTSLISARSTTKFLTVSDAVFDWYKGSL